MINEGDEVPALKTRLSDGTDLDLSTPGGPLVLYFYPKDDTSGCTREAQDFTALAGDFAKAGVRVVGLSRDPMKKHVRLLKQTRGGLVFFEGHCEQDGEICYAFTGTLKRVTRPNAPAMDDDGARR